MIRQIRIDGETGVINKDVLEVLNYHEPVDQEKVNVARVAVDKYTKEKSKLLKADLIKIIEDIIPIVE